MRQIDLIKRLVGGFVLLFLLVLPVNAQEGLQVDKIFQRFGHAKGCKMVEMNHVRLREYQLAVYKSLTYKKIGASVDYYLAEERKKAKKIREVVEDGRIVSGYYMMPPLSKAVNRYVLFSKAGDANGTVIYIEGDLSPDDIMKLCYSKR